jgi:hypothetical protein
LNISAISKLKVFALSFEVWRYPILGSNFVWFIEFNTSEYIIALPKLMVAFISFKGGLLLLFSNLNI